MSPTLRSGAYPRVGLQLCRPIAAALGLITCTVVLFAFNPANLAIPLCPFHALTGLYCPGCGTLRAVHQLLHGQVLVALELNPLIILSLPLTVYGILYQASAHLTRRQLHNIRIPRYCVWTLAGIVIAFWVLRNIPVYPFSALAP